MVIYLDAVESLFTLPVRSHWPLCSAGDIVLSLTWLVLVIIWAKVVKNAGFDMILYDFYNQLLLINANIDLINSPFFLFVDPFDSLFLHHQILFGPFFLITGWTHVSKFKGEQPPPPPPPGGGPFTFFF